MRGLERVGASFDLEADLLAPRSALRGALEGLLPRRDPPLLTLLLSPGEQPAGRSGFLQARRHRGGESAEIVALAPSLEAERGASIAWQRLLSDACKRLGASGVQRLYAAIPDGDALALQVFRQAGFAAYTTDLVFRAELAPEAEPRGQDADLVPLDGGAREAELRGLQERGRPTTVRAAEGPTPDWALYPMGGRWPKGSRAVARLDARGAVQGGWRVLPGRRAAWLRIVCAEEADAGPLLRAALETAAALQDEGARELWTAVRGHEASLNLALRDEGFQPVGGRFRLVKHTTVRRMTPEWREQAAHAGAAGRPIARAKASRAAPDAPPDGMIS